jgi:hypothetical protein
MRTYGVKVIKFYIFLTSVLDRGLHACLATGERHHCTYWTGSWISPRANLNMVVERKTLSLLGTVNIRKMFHTEFVGIFTVSAS